MTNQVTIFVSETKLLWAVDCQLCTIPGNWELILPYQLLA